jgi:hypothetical protein
MTFGLEPPKNFTNLFGHWLNGIPKRDLVEIRVGVCAVLWAMCNTLYDLIFSKPETPSFLQVIPIVTHWIHMWSYLQQQRDEMDFGRNRLEKVARDLFNWYN